MNIDQNYKSGDVWSEEFPIVSVKLFYWLEYFIQKNRTSLRDRSQFVAICVVCYVIKTRIYSISAVLIHNGLIESVMPASVPSNLQMLLHYIQIIDV